MLWVRPTGAADELFSVRIICMVGDNQWVFVVKIIYVYGAMIYIQNFMVLGWGRDRILSLVITIMPNDSQLVKAIRR